MTAGKGWNFLLDTIEISGTDLHKLVETRDKTPVAHCLECEEKLKLTRYYTWEECKIVGPFCKECRDRRLKGEPDDKENDRKGS
jgi:hypothetical protein